MKNREQLFADCVGAIYEAATGGIGWREVGAKLCTLLDAQSFVVCGSDGIENMLMSNDEAQAVYNAYYHSLNPYAARARADYARDKPSHIATARPGEALVSEAALVHSEYYVDFARPYEQRYMIGGMLGIREATPLALYRPHGHQAFDAQDVRWLQMLLPHFQRALELDERIGASRMSLAALDVLPTAVAIVDAELRVRYLNAAGRSLINASRSPLTTVCSGPYGGAVHLAAQSRRETNALHRLVSSAANDGATGSVRVSGKAESFAALVSPAPCGLLAEDRGPGLVAGYALLLLQPLRGAKPPPLSMLCDVLGLTLAEAEVAAALFGGRSAEQVAKERGVSLPTVRNQIRSILVKADAENLRDLERVMSDLKAIAFSPSSP